MSFTSGQAQGIEDFVAQRRERVAVSAISELRAATAEELPALLHRLAGKLDVFGFPTAGAAVRELLGDLPDQLAELEHRATHIASVLQREVTP
ncbi:hypothetical protein ACFQ06_14070 [Tessaracoccus lubricantis]|uniref:hypothetical protein n=1 Tax=Tessaracoccus lubricantis TaxID=545543 RepID=UPI0031E7FF62